MHISNNCCIYCISKGSKDRQIAEWDWDTFTCGEEYMNYVESLLDEAVENCRDREIELI